MKALKRCIAALMTVILIAASVIAVLPTIVHAAGGTVYEFDVTALSAEKDKEEIPEGTLFADYFKTFGVMTKRWADGKGVTSVEVGKAGSSGIQFTVSGTSADVTVVASSTGGSNESEYTLTDEGGNVVANNEGVTVLAGTTKTTLTYTELPAGTYKLISPENPERSRGYRIYSVTVDALEAVTTVYTFDYSTLTAEADKEEIDEGTLFDNFIKTFGKVQKRWKAESGVTSVEVGKAGSSGFTFEITGTADAKIVTSSTGGSNESEVGLVDGSGNLVANTEGITYVSGTGKKELVYTALPAGTYKFISPENPDRNRGARVFTIEVTETTGGTRPPRADWASVADPAFTSTGVNGGDIIANYSMPIGYDGADQVVIALHDSETGDEIDSRTIGAEGEGGTATFTPDASGTYYLTIKAVRADEEDKYGADSAPVNFTLPLEAPQIKNTVNQGSGKLALNFYPVPEAERYSITKDGEEIAIFEPEDPNAEEYSYVVEELTAGSEVTLGVTALRGDERSEETTITAEVTADAEQEWAYANFGSNATTNRAKSGYTKNDDGSVTVYNIGNSGKIVPNSTDGLSFYYAKIPADKNFTLSATATIDEWTFTNGQEGFGLMAADRVGKDGENRAFWNNVYMAIGTKVEYNADADGNVTDDATAKKISMKNGLGVTEKTGVTAENLADFEGESSTEAVNNYFKSTTRTLETSAATMDAGTYNVLGNATAAVPGTLDNALTVFKLKIQKNNTGYFVSYEDADGNVRTEKYYDTKALEKIDSEYVYAGFFASRAFRATYSDISLTLIDPADDAPAEEKPVTYVTPNYKVVSATAANKADYDLVFVANADGTVSVKNEAGDVIADALAVTANEKLAIPVTLAEGANKFIVTMTPQEGYQPEGEGSALSSYDPAELSHTVTFENLGEEDGKLYVAPNGTPDGAGTKESPIDIFTAVKVVRAGQTIVCAGGTYNLTSGVTVQRGISGTAEKEIVMCADPDMDERPVFDFGGVGSGFIFAGDYWYCQGFDVTNTRNGVKGLQVSGAYSTFDDIVAYRNGNTGIQVSRYLSSDAREDWPHDDLILNCTSYANADAGFEDADGFAAKLTCGDNIVFDGCLAYNNADDGWDLFAKVETGTIGMVTIKNSIAYGNGLTADGQSMGNGNGFKMGGESLSGKHTIINSVAFLNKAKGIDCNSCPDINVIRCTSFNNGSYNTAFYTNNAKNTDFSATGLVSYCNNNGENDQMKLLGTQDLSKVYKADTFLRVDGVTRNTEGLAVDDSWFVDVTQGADAVTRLPDGRLCLGTYLKQSDAAKTALENANLDPNAIMADLHTGAEGTASREIEIPSDITYADVPEDAWYHDSVYEMTKAGLTSGRGTTADGQPLFQPTLTATRAEVVTFLHRLAGSPEVEGTSTFTDVKDSDWFAKPVIWAAANGITSGYGEGTFQPNAKVTRAMMVTFLKNYAEKIDGQDVSVTEPADFTDVKDTDWFKPSVDWAAAKGVTSGYGEGTFAPQVSINRAMLITFVNNYRKMPKVYNS